MERVATDGLKKLRQMPRSSIADFCNKIGTSWKKRSGPEMSVHWDEAVIPIARSN
jgi:hypothetical protein